MNLTQNNLRHRTGFEALNNLIPALKENKVATVAVHYSGCGDEGSIEDIEFFDTKEEPFTDAQRFGPLQPGEVIEQLKDAAYTILEEQYGGWEIDSGSDGTINLDVQSGKISIEHAQHFISTDYHSKDFQL